MELYVDGVLDTFKAFSGAIQPSTKPFTIGRMDNVETQYALLGSVDEVKLWDKEIPVRQIESLKNQFSTSSGINENYSIERIYPNPARDVIYVEFTDNLLLKHVSLFTSDGKEVSGCNFYIQSSGIKIEIPRTKPGLYLLRMILKDDQVITRKIIIR